MPRFKYPHDVLSFIDAICLGLSRARSNQIVGLSFRCFCVYGLVLVCSLDGSGAVGRSFDGRVLLEAVYHGIGAVLRAIWGSFDCVCCTDKEDVTRSVLRQHPIQSTGVCLRFHAFTDVSRYATSHESESGGHGTRVHEHCTRVDECLRAFPCIH